MCEKTKSAYRSVNVDAMLINQSNRYCGCPFLNVHIVPIDLIEEVQEG